MISILISSHERFALLKRTLYSIRENRPKEDFELILCDDGSSPETTKAILGELRLYSQDFSWKFIRVDKEIFEKETGIKIFWNNPAWTNNVAYRHSNPAYPLIVQQGNEVLATKGVYGALVNKLNDRKIVASSTTYDVPKYLLEGLDSYGTQLGQKSFFGKFLNSCLVWPLQSQDYITNVTNYLCMAHRDLWEEIGGYDERYLNGIAAEDSDFVRRARAASYRYEIVPDISFHQSHGGKTRYYQANPSVIPLGKFQQGCRINSLRYNSWDGQIKNSQEWPWGRIGVVDIITN